MSKKKDFDISSITKKFNLDGIMDNVKSIISPTSITIDAEDGDQVGALLAHMNELVKECAVEHEKQEQRLGQISKTSAQIYALLHQDDKAESATPAKEKPAEKKEDAPKKAAEDESKDDSEK
jgi:hypothetical protein